MMGWWGAVLRAAVATSGEAPPLRLSSRGRDQAARRAHIRPGNQTGSGVGAHKAACWVEAIDGAVTIGVLLITWSNESASPVLPEQSTHVHSLSTLYVLPMRSYDSLIGLSVLVQAAAHGQLSDAGAT